MKTPAQIRAIFDAYLESATDPVTRPAAQSFEAGMAMGALLSLANALDEPELQAKAREAVRGFDEPAEPPFVCPGCYAVGEEPCAPGCIDAEIERAREERDSEDDWRNSCGDCEFSCETGAPECEGCDR
jgi:hypothetical protein